MMKDKRKTIVCYDEAFDVDFETMSEFRIKVKEIMNLNRAFKEVIKENV